MITLKLNTKLVAYCLEAAVTNQVTFDTAFYSNKLADADVFEDTLYGELNDTTDVDICDIPATGYHWNVTHIKLFNNDTIPHTIEIAKDLSGTQTVLYRISLNPNENWEYPLPVNNNRTIQKAITNIGRTLTLENETLTLADIGTQLISNYTGVGFQKILIEEGVFSVGMSVDVIRVGNPYKYEIENAVTQDINIEYFGGKIGNKTTLLFREQGVKEEWNVFNGNKIGLALQDVIHDSIIGVEEDDDYIYMSYASYQAWLNISTIYTTDVQFKIIDKNTGIENLQKSPNVLGIQSRGLFRLHMINIIYNVALCYGTYSLLTRYILQSFLKSLGLTFEFNSTQGGYQKVVEYEISGTKRVLSRNGVGSTQTIIEDIFAGDVFTATGRTFATGTNNQGFYSGCWDGVESTGAGTAYLLVAKRVGGMHKVDIHDLSSVATLARDSVIFVNIKEIDGYGWYVRANTIGRVKFSDMSNTEWVIGFTLVDARFVGAKIDETEGIIYAAEYNGYRYVIFDINDPDNYTVVNISADLGAMTICGLSYLASTKKLYIHAYGTGDIAGAYIGKTLVYQM